MQITLVHIGPKGPSKDAFEELTQAYLQRISAYQKCETVSLRSEEAFFEWAGRQQGRIPALLVLLDSRGRTMSSEAFANWLGSRREDGAQHIAFAVGPASGWSDAARKRAGLLLSFGPMTMAHALARLVLAEQIYRACTILAGHPYHSGH